MERIKIGENSVKRPPLDLSMRFATLGAVIALMIAMVARTYFVRQQRNAMELRLREKVLFINKFYDFLIADSLARKDDVTLLQVINRLEEDPEITSVLVVDQKKEVRYHVDPEKIGSIWEEDTLIDNVLKSGEGVVTPFKNSGGKAVVLVSPLNVTGIPQSLGAVRIELTHRHIEKQIAQSETHFYLVTLGAMLFCIGLMFMGVKRWISHPLNALRQALAGMNPLSLEGNLPETSDEWGRLHTALNDLFLRLKAEWQTQQSDTQNRAHQEKDLIEQLARSFLPDTRVIMADKDNRVLSDSGNGVHPYSEETYHLLDLITDANFANLINTAFQKEGDVVRGPVVFQDKAYEAAVLSVPAHHTVLVKTLITLKPSEIK